MILYRRGSRYFAVQEASRDLLGDLVIVAWHGASDNRLGGQRSIPVADEEQGEAVVAAIEKRRLQRGYQRFTGVPGQH